MPKVRIMLMLPQLMCLLQENVSRQGLSAMNLTLDFDEVNVLRENMAYLHNTLEVSAVVISSLAGLPQCGGLV